MSKVALITGGQQGIGLHRKRAGKAHAHPLAAGQRIHGPVRQMADIGGRQCGGHGGGIGRRGAGKPALMWQAAEERSTEQRRREEMRRDLESTSGALLR